ncbi:MAG: hypothetical protein E7774_12690 [Bradyrhizobium sp.]|nr:MAG: hypothetical protein E7774_12690 [Bradyrhizobium sp.]
MAEDKTSGVQDEAPRQNLASEASTPPDPIDANVKDHISRHLKLMYDTVAGQPIPDRFLELLNQLDGKLDDEDA